VTNLIERISNENMGFFLFTSVLGGEFWEIENEFVGIL
jgi:hypothetical protein